VSSYFSRLLDLRLKCGFGKQVHCCLGVLWNWRGWADLAVVEVAEELSLGSQQDIPVRHSIPP
jgi:hypothetical protein